MNTNHRNDTISPIFVANKDCKVPHWIPPVSRNSTNIASGSWFDIKKVNRLDPVPIHEIPVTFPIIPPDSLKQQKTSITKKKKRIEKLEAEKLLGTNESENIGSENVTNTKPSVKIKYPDKLTPAFITCEKVRIYPTKEQKIVFNNWFDACTDMFNITVKFVERNIYMCDPGGRFILDVFGHKILVTNITKSFLYFENIRSLLKEERNKIINRMKVKILTHIIDQAISQAVSCFKSSITSMIKIDERINLFIENNPDKPVPMTPTFRIRPLKHIRPRRVMKIEPQYFGKNGTFCPTVFDKIEPPEKLENIDSTVTFLHDRASKKYILMVPIRNIIIENRPKKHDALGIDLGVRTFITAYSQNHTWSICNHSRQWKLHNYIRKIDNIKKWLSKKKNAAELKSLANKHMCVLDQINRTDSEQDLGTLYRKETQIQEQIDSAEIRQQNILTRLEEKDKANKKRREKKGIQLVNERTKEPKKCSLVRALKKYEAKKQDLVKDMHYKTANILVKDYDRIYIGNLSTKKIVSRNNVTITKKTKKTILALAPYKFKQILTHMGNKHGCVVTEVSEYLTSKTCSSCGKMYEIGRSKVYECSGCGMKADRDENSAKTHLKLGLMKEILASANSRISRKRQVVKIV